MSLPLHPPSRDDEAERAAARLRGLIRRLLQQAMVDCSRSCGDGGGSGDRRHASQDAYRQNARHTKGVPGAPSDGEDDEAGADGASPQGRTRARKGGVHHAQVGSGGEADRLGAPGGGGGKGDGAGLRHVASDVGEGNGDAIRFFGAPILPEGFDPSKQVFSAEQGQHIARRLLEASSGYGLQPGRGRSVFDPLVVRPNHALVQCLRMTRHAVRQSEQIGNGALTRTSFVRPSALGRACHLPLPGKRTALRYAVVVVDTSGSISDEYILKIVIPSVASILISGYDKIVLAQYDAALHREVIVDAPSALAKRVSTWVGRGGTRMDNALRYVYHRFIHPSDNAERRDDGDARQVDRQIVAQGRPPAAVYVITDGQTRWGFAEADRWPPETPLVILRIGRHGEWPGAPAHHRVWLADPNQPRYEWYPAAHLSPARMVKNPTTGYTTT